MLPLRSDTRKKSPIKVHGQSLMTVTKSKLRQVFTSPSSIIANEFKIRIPSKPNGQDKGKARTTRKILPQNSTISSQGGGDKTKSKIVARNSIEAREYQTKLQLQLFAKPTLKAPGGHKKKVGGKILKQPVLVEDCFPPIPPIAILSTPPTFPVLLPQPTSQVQKVPSTKKTDVPFAVLEKNKRKIEEKFLKKTSTQKVSHFKTADVKARPPPPATKKTTKNEANAKKPATKKEPPKSVPLEIKSNIDEQTRKTKQKKDEIKDKYSPRVREIWRKLDYHRRWSSGRRLSGSSKSRTSKGYWERSHVNQENAQKVIEAKQKVRKDETVKQTKAQIQKDETVNDILTEAHRMIWSWLFSGLTANNQCDPVTQANFVSDETKNNKQ